MLVSLLEQVRTERGTNASRRYRYQRMCLLRCEICGKERRVQYTKQVRVKTEHPCKPLKIKRTLERQERVHHIDGDKQNNSPDNLYVCSSNSSHRDVHTSLEDISFKLVQHGIIKFNHTTGTYYLPHLEEILDVYSVNSEKTYVLSIDNLGNMAILSQADKLSEGATIIPLGSRVQENSKRGES